MKKFFLAIFASLSVLNSGIADLEMPNLNPFRMYKDAVQETQLISIDVSVWDIYEHEPEDSEELLDKELEEVIGARFKQRGLDEDIYKNLERQPSYAQHEDFYYQQFLKAASFWVSVYRKEYAVFVDIWCLKNFDEYSLPIYACNFRVENDPEWWGNVQNLVLEHVEEFLDEFTSINKGPYGWEQL